MNKLKCYLKFGKYRFQTGRQKGFWTFKEGQEIQQFSITENNKRRHYLVER